MRWNKSFEGTLHIYDADLQKMAKMLGDVNIKECPYFDLSDRYGNSARYYRENQWIPCSERLPDVGQKVLASTNKTCFTQVFKGTSGASNSSWWWEKNTIKHIFAWRPLPEPWKGEDKC